MHRARDWCTSYSGSKELCVCAWVVAFQFLEVHDTPWLVSWETVTRDVRMQRWGVRRRLRGSVKWRPCGKKGSTSLSSSSSPISLLRERERERESRGDSVIEISRAQSYGRKLTLPLFIVRGFLVKRWLWVFGVKHLRECHGITCPISLTQSCIVWPFQWCSEMCNHIDLIYCTYISL